MASNTNKDYTQMHIKASDHPKAYAPHILILNIVMNLSQHISAHMLRQPLMIRFHSWDLQLKWHR